MAYERQNFVPGQVLTAECLNRIEGGICDSDSRYENHENCSAHITDEERVKWNNKADKSAVPTKTSQLTNDSGFLTQHQSLSGYAKTADHYTKAESDDKYQPKGNYLIAVPSEYVTETELNNKGYALACDVPTNTNQLSNGAGYLREVDLVAKGYGSQKDIDILMSGYLLNGAEKTLTVGEDIQVGQTLKLYYYLADGYSYTASKGDELIMDSHPGVTGNPSYAYDCYHFVVGDYDSYTFTGVYSEAPTTLVEQVKTNAENIRSLSDHKADKATTLAGYGITDGVKQSDFDVLASTVIEVNAKTGQNAIKVDDLAFEKVSKTDIVDSLESEASDKPLSAKQGNFLHMDLQDVNNSVGQMRSQIGQLSEQKADKSYIIAKLEELKQLILNGDIDSAVALFDEAIFDLSTFS